MNTAPPIINPYKTSKLKTANITQQPSLLQLNNNKNKNKKRPLTETEKLYSKILLKDEAAAAKKQPKRSSGAFISKNNKKCIQQPTKNVLSENDNKKNMLSLISSLNNTKGSDSSIGSRSLVEMKRKLVTHGAASNYYESSKFIPLNNNNDNNNNNNNKTLVKSLNSKVLRSGLNQSQLNNNLDINRIKTTMTTIKRTSVSNRTTTKSVFKRNISKSIPVVDATGSSFTSSVGFCRPTMQQSTVTVPSSKPVMTEIPPHHHDQPKTSSLSTHTNSLSNNNRRVITAASDSVLFQGTLESTINNHLPSMTKEASVSVVKKKQYKENFVKLNLKNSAGACRGARNKKFKKKWNNFKKKDYSLKSGGADRGCDMDEGEEKKTGHLYACNTTVADPLDEYLDGRYDSKGLEVKTTIVTEEGVTLNVKSVVQNKKDLTDTNLPCCRRHNRPCKVVKVSKSGANKGRKFYACSFPRGEQCDFFQWIEDSEGGIRSALLNSSSHSGFVARQVNAHRKRWDSLTVPELREELRRKDLNSAGKKSELLARLLVWVRDEIANSELHQAQDETTTQSESDGELEFCDMGNNILPFFNFDGMIGSEENSFAKNVTLGAGFEDDKIEECLYEIFGHKSFRPGQKWAIKRCLEGHKSLLVAATGSGKSLCYALPAALLNGITIVVSPLIALIQDQLRSLPPCIPAATLSGGMSASETALVIDDVLKGRIKLLYLSPEKIVSGSFRRLLQGANAKVMPPISLLCVDEAHCLSQWGHNFRPSYLRLQSTIRLLKPRSILALTATAGPKVINDICRTLKISVDNTDDGRQSVKESPSTDDGVLCLNTKRSNITCHAKLFNDDDTRRSTLLKMLGPATKQVSPNPRESLDSEETEKEADLFKPGALSKGSIIVYVWRKYDCETLTEFIRESGYADVCCYHGGMDQSQRTNAQNKFIRGKARICVATVAFGLGINKSDISAVVHMCLPQSPEHYIQEIGRAGRGGQSSSAYALLLPDEYLVKHSLSHSDSISLSQITHLLSYMKSSCQPNVIFTTNDNNMDSSDIAAASETTYFPYHIAVPMNDYAKELDMKRECIETVFTILEEDGFLSIENSSLRNDALIVLKKRKLEALAMTGEEQLCKALLEVGEKIKDEVGSEMSRDKQSFFSYSHGQYKFSVLSVALKLKIPTRHVYGMLSRLEKAGEVEVKYGPQIYHHILVHSSNLLLDGHLRKISDRLYQRMKIQEDQQVKKTDVIHNLLCTLASSEYSREQQELFQEALARSVDSSFDGNVVSLESRKSDSQVSHRQDLDKKKVLLKSEVFVLNQISSFPDEIFFRKNKSIAKANDYRSLYVTKILHGLVRVEGQLWTSVDQWRAYRFEDLKDMITNLVDDGSK